MKKSLFCCKNRILILLSCIRKFLVLLADSNRHFSCEVLANVILKQPQPVFQRFLPFFQSELLVQLKQDKRFPVVGSKQGFLLFYFFPGCLFIYIFHFLNQRLLRQTLLQDIAVCPKRDRPLGIGKILMAAHNNHPWCQPSLTDFPDKGKAVHLCHLNIRQHNIHHIFLQKMQRFLCFPKDP